MTGHDPMCPYVRPGMLPCQCALISRVREAQDEVSFLNGWKAGFRAAAAAVAAAVAKRYVESQRLGADPRYAEGYRVALDAVGTYVRRIGDPDA